MNRLDRLCHQGVVLTGREHNVSDVYVSSVSGAVSFHYNGLSKSFLSLSSFLPLYLLSRIEAL